MSRLNFDDLARRIPIFLPITVVVSVSMKTNVKLDVPPVLLTVLGVSDSTSHCILCLICSARCRHRFRYFISCFYRVISHCIIAFLSEVLLFSSLVFQFSYSHYWLGRTCWSDMMRNARGMSRVIWFHVPPRLSPFTAEEIAQGMSQRSQDEMLKVMAEKRMALDLIEGYASIFP